MNSLTDFVFCLNENLRFFYYISPFFVLKKLVVLLCKGG